MSHPKRRHSRTRGAKRRTHDAIKTVASLSECPNCRKAKMPHRVCPECGFYKNASIV